MTYNFKLPENLKSWKIISCLPDNNGNEIYKISKKEYDGTVTNALLRRVVIENEDYNIENTDFINDEASFLKTISQSGDCFNYIDFSVNNKPAKNRIEFFIITEDLKSLTDIMKSTEFDEAKIIDFGIQISEILEKLEAKGIFHGNITPDNIYVTNDGRYKLGGFSDFESKIEDMSFIAPEISKKENADFTTDIYSLGLIMYSMSNSGKIPFENDETSRNDAIKMRFDGKAVVAPKNGSEKLKSVIVIACQPNNNNRWKNAGNIKNALSSIKKEISSSPNDESLIIPETTDFDGNVFEEYDYNSFDDTAKSSAEVLPVLSTISEPEAEPMSTAETPEETAGDFEEVSAGNSENDFPKNNYEILSQSDNAPEIEKTEDNTDNLNAPEALDNSKDFEIDNRIFETYEVQKKAKSFQEQAKEKDYGDYFEEEPKPKAVTDNTSEYDVENDKPFNVFETEDSDENNTQEKTGNKKNAVIITICVIVTLAAFTFIAYCLLGGFGANNGNNGNNAPTETTEASTAQQTTIAPTTQTATTVPATTAAPTTAPIEKNVIPVVGYGYSYAKKLLEQDGFVVEIGEYDYSEEWPEGYVIAQTPSGDTTAESGTVVTLDISLGLIEPETTAAPTEPVVQATAAQTKPVQSNNATDSSYIFPNSSSSYLSKSEVSSLSNNDLDLALNEIYARNGRIFKAASLSQYFSSKTWYTPKYTADEFAQKVTFNSYEQKNLQLIIDEQKKRGMR